MHAKVKTNTEIKLATSRAHFLLFVPFINHAFCCPMHLFCSTWPCWQCKHQDRGATVRLCTAHKMWVSAVKLIAVCDLWPLPLLTPIPIPLATASATGQTLWADGMVWGKKEGFVLLPALAVTQVISSLQQFIASFVLFFCWQNINIMHVYCKLSIAV